MPDWKCEAAGYKGYDPSAIPKRFQLHEGLHLGVISDSIAALAENVALKSEELREGFRSLIVKVSQSVLRCKTLQWPPASNGRSSNLMISLIINNQLEHVKIFYYKCKSQVNCDFGKSVHQ